MIIRIYVRASTKEQDAERALAGLIEFSQNYGTEYVAYIENESGTKLNRPILNQLLSESLPGHRPFLRRIHHRQINHLTSRIVRSVNGNLNLTPLGPNSAI